MDHALRAMLLLLALLGGTPQAANAGWILQWTHVALNTRGGEISSEASTMYVAGGRVRTEQPKIVSITDYRTERLTFLDPARELFWSGTVDEYVSEMKRLRNAALNAQMGEEAGPGEPMTDLTQLPKIEIRSSGETKEIASHQVSKHEIFAGGEPFQEVWVADGLNLSADLDPQRFLSLQLKMSGSMLGKSALAYNALYRDEQYKKLLRKGFALQLKTVHIAGSYERTATSVRDSTVPDEMFGVPEEYRRVRLEDVFPKEG
jgi:hypothetical protein